jgi:hypothetical protein
VKTVAFELDGTTSPLDFVLDNSLYNIHQIYLYKIGDGAHITPEVEDVPVNTIILELGGSQALHLLYLIILLRLGFKSAQNQRLKVPLMYRD